MGYLNGLSQLCFINMVSLGHNKTFFHVIELSESLLLSFAVSKKTLGDRVLSVTAPRLWNALPEELSAINCIDTFKRRLTEGHKLYGHLQETSH